MPKPEAGGGRLLRRLHPRRRSSARERVHPVFLLDEAHLLHQDTLDHLHILLNYEWDSPRAALALPRRAARACSDRLALRRNRSLYSRLHAALSHRARSPPTTPPSTSALRLAAPAASASSSPPTPSPCSTRPPPAPCATSTASPPPRCARPPARSASSSSATSSPRHRGPDQRRHRRLITSRRSEGPAPSQRWPSRGWQPPLTPRDAHRPRWPSCPHRPMSIVPADCRRSSQRCPSSSRAALPSTSLRGNTGTNRRYLIPRGVGHRQRRDPNLVGGARISDGDSWIPLSAAMFCGVVKWIRGQLYAELRVPVAPFGSSPGYALNR